MKRLLFFMALILVMPNCKKDEIKNNFHPSKKVFGINFGPYEGAQDPTSGITLTVDQLGPRLDRIKEYTEYIRIFGATHGLEAIPALARDKGMKVYASAWLSADLAANDVEIASLIELGRSGDVEALVVGSEVLLRGDLEAEQLIGYLNLVRASLPALRVTTAERYDILLNHPEVMAACDFMFVNIYPFWNGEAVECAVYRVQQAWQQVQDSAGGKEIIISESGWPTAGITIGDAIPSEENACLYLSQLAKWSKEMNVKTFLFEAFDEPWKANYEGEVGAHWGIFDKDGKLKGCMESLFDQAAETSFSKCPLLTPPIAFFTSVPPKGSQANLSGCTAGVNPSNFSITILIKVQGQWWVKPYSAARKTPIGEDGCWSGDITTGGNDAAATEICAFLIPASYDPPNVTGTAVIPAELEDVAVGKICVVRQ